MTQSIKSIREEALKYRTRGEFQKNSHSVYIAAWRMKILDEVCRHMNKIYNSWDTNSLTNEALKYNSRIEFKKGSPSAYAIALKRDDFEKICAHMSHLYVYWTDEMLYSEALKYNTRGNFQKGSNSAYQIAYKKGILENICSHMPPASNEAYTLEELQLEADKYLRRSEFEKYSRKAYMVCLKRKIMDAVCSHMRPSSGSSNSERELFDIVKTVYPNIKKIRDMKVKIEGKPYIKGFEIDILVENKGIEFDGKYHHSFKFMRNDPKKFKWSDDDIRDYHKIKDGWFTSKGIQILHIKEEDWIKDKEKCIQKCLNFLGVK